MMTSRYYSIAADLCNEIVSGYAFNKFAIKITIEQVL